MLLPARLAPLLLASSLFLVSSASAQIGTFTSFGKGCPASIGKQPGCLSANFTGSWIGTKVATTYAFRVQNLPKEIRICAFEFYAATNGGNATKRAWVYSDGGIRGPGTLLATSQIHWTAIPGWHRATLKTPITVKPNGVFILAFENPGRAPDMANPAAAVAYWAGRGWSGPFSHPFNYNVVCCDELTPPTPVLDAIGVPSMWLPYYITLHRALPNALAGLIFGASNSSWGQVPLPFDLGQLGAPGCPLLVSFDDQLWLSRRTSGGG